MEALERRYEVVSTDRPASRPRAAREADARRAGESLRPTTHLAWAQVREGLRRSLRERHPTTDATAWGGLVVLLWMAGYFAILLPTWAHYIVVVFSR